MSAFGATLLRITLGALFVLHGDLAYFALEPGGPAELVDLVGRPLGTALAWYLVVAQVLGGLMMIAGLWTRWAALANVPILLGAVLLLHRGEGFFMAGAAVDAGAAVRVVGIEYPLLVLVATIAQALLGGGAWSMTDD
jgi:putative oxidoreductase